MIKSSILITLFAVIISNNVFAQKYVAKNAEISFYSKTPAEDISAVNKTVTSVLTTNDKKVAAVIVMSKFKFEKPLMEEHFNENYLETAKYPKSTFLGSYVGDVDPNKDGTYNVTMKGDLVLHGVKNSVQFPATITVKNGTLSAKGKTQIALVDYKIEVPKLVFYKIAEKIDVSLNLLFNKS